MPIPWQHVIAGRAYRTTAGDVWHGTAIFANGDIVFHAASDMEVQRMAGEEFAAAVDEMVGPEAK